MTLTKNRPLLSALFLLSIFTSSCGPTMSSRLCSTDEIDASNATALWLQTHYGLVTAPEVRLIVGRITARLAAAFPGSGVQISDETLPYPWQVYVLRTDEPNAFSTGAGIIFLTRGLILSTRSEAELAAVLSHEMAHHYLGHTALLKSSLSSSQVGTTPGTAPASPAFAFSLDQELAADAASLKVLKAARYDLRDALNALSLGYRSQQRIVSRESDDNAPDWLATRVAALRNGIENAGDFLPATRSSREFAKIQYNLTHSAGNS